MEKFKEDHAIDLTEEERVAKLDENRIVAKELIDESEHWFIVAIREVRDKEDSEIINSTGFTFGNEMYLARAIAEGLLKIGIDEKVVRNMMIKRLLNR